MSVSAVIRFFIAIFEWLETYVLPSVRSLVHTVRTCCALWLEKLDLFRIRFLFWFSGFLAQLDHRWSDLRHMVAHRRDARRSQVQKRPVSRFWSLVRDGCIDVLIYGLSACALFALWRFAFRL